MLKFSATTLAGSPIAGSVDGPLKFANFSRPSGILKVDDFLFITDRSVGSSIRVIYHEQVRSIRFKGSSELLQAAGMCYSTGSLFIADRGHDKIRYIMLPTLNQQFFEGLINEQYELCTIQTPQLKRPAALLMYKENLVVADSGSGRVLQLQLSKQFEATRVMELCRLGRPEGLVEMHGQLLVVDSLLHQIIEVDVDQRRTVAGSTVGLQDGMSSQAKFRGCCGIAQAANRLFVVERDNCAIRMVDNGTVSTLSNKKGYADGPDFSVDEPGALVAYVQDGLLKLVVCDTKNSCVRVIQAGIDVDQPVVVLKKPVQETDDLKDQIDRQVHSSMTGSQLVQSKVIPLLKMAPSSTLNPLLQRMNLNPEEFFGLFNQMPFIPDKCVQLILKQDYSCLYPVAFAFIDYFKLVDVFWDLSKLNDLEVQNLKTLQLYRTFCLHRLLSYDGSLLKRLITSPEQHSAAVTACAGRCVKIRLQLNNQILKLNNKQQFLAAKADFDRLETVQLQIDLQICVQTQDNKISVAFADGLVTDDSVYYLEGEDVEFRGRKMRMFVKSFKYVLPKAVIENAWAPKANPVQKIDVRMEDEGFLVSIDFGAGSEKRAAKDVPRIFALEMESVAAKV